MRPVDPTQIRMIQKGREEYETLTGQPVQWGPYPATADAASQVIDKMIDVLEAARRHGTEGVGAEGVEGMWIFDGGTYKIQRAVHGSGHLYAKVLNALTGRFHYVPGAVRQVIDSGHRMSLEEAQAYGRLYGRCCVCSRTLTDEQSIEDGIGPICGAKMRKGN